MNTKNTETDENIKTEYEGGVGALLTIEIDGKKKAILQKRTTNDSFPGCLQVTVHGGLEKTGRMKPGTNRAERESMIVGLKREIREEVREMLERSMKYNSAATSKEENESTSLEDVANRPELYFPQEAQILAVHRKAKAAKDKGEKNIRKTDVTLGFHTKGNIIGVDVIKNLEKDGIIVLLSAEELNKLVPLDAKLHKENGVQEEGKYGMFADEIKAVKKSLGVVE